MKNFILSTFSALLLGFIAAGAQNPRQPPAGTYNIINSALSSSNQKLAVEYRKDHLDVIVTPLTDSDVQRWTVTLGEQFIIPITDQSVAATGESGDTVTIRPKNGFVWTITNLTTTGNYTIADQSRYWGLNNPIVNENIVLGPRNAEDQTQNWFFQQIN